MDQSLVGDGSGKWLLLGIIQSLSLSVSLNVSFCHCPSYPLTV